MGMDVMIMKCENCNMPMHTTFGGAGRTVCNPYSTNNPAKCKCNPDAAESGCYCLTIASKQKQKIIVKERPYEEIQVREITEYSLEDFIIMAITRGDAFITTCDGLLIKCYRDATKPAISLRGKNILILNFVDYCFSHHKPIFTTKSKMNINAIQENTNEIKAIANMIWKKKRKDMNHE